MLMNAFPDATSTSNRRFQASGFVFGNAPNVWLRAQAHHWKPGQRVLCAADGEGRNSVWLARQGLQVDAFDIAEAGLAKARGLAADAGLTASLAAGDGDSVVWPEAVHDGVAANLVQFADSDILELREYEAGLSEGPGHSGRSALIGMVAQRR